MEMELKDYQRMTGELAIYPGTYRLMGLIYVTLGLSGEAGEVANKVKKIMRDESFTITPEFKEALINELGDVFWYLSQCATELDTTLEHIAALNIAKLQSRKGRSVLKGSGDNR